MKTIEEIINNVPNIFELFVKFLQDKGENKSVLYDIDDIDDLLTNVKASEIIRMCQRGFIDYGEYFYFDEYEGIHIVEDEIDYYKDIIDLEEFKEYLKENNIKE